MKVEMDNIQLKAPYQDGWYIFSNHTEKHTTDIDGCDRISYEADAIWQLTDPDLTTE